MACTLSPPCKITPRAFADFPAPEFGSRAVGKKAAANRLLNKVWLDPAVYNAIKDPRGRLALIFHEYGHLEGADCEECADRRAGELLREHGSDADAAAEMFRNLLEHRSGDDAANNILGGYYQTNDTANAEGCQCEGGVIDRSGLCKVPVLSFAKGESAFDRRAKARLRGLDPGQCGCLHRGAVSPLPASAMRKARRIVAAQPKRDAAADASVTDGGAPVVSAMSSDDVAAELAQKAPTSNQNFATTVNPRDPLWQILADTAAIYFPSDPRTAAYMMLAIINHEAGRIAKGQPGAGGYDAASINYNYTDGSVGADSQNSPGPKGPDSARTVRSTDYGLGQINSKYHADMIAQTITDANGNPQPAWPDARQNVDMIARILKPACDAFPNDPQSALNAYAYGASNVAKGTWPHWVNGAGQTISTAPPGDTGTAELAFLKTLGFDPTATPLPTPDSTPLAAVAAAVTSTLLTIGDITAGRPVPSKMKRDALWVGAALVLLVIGAWLIMRDEIHPLPRRRAHAGAY